MIERIAVVGLGYVGLPLAVAIARSGNEVIGFDIKKSRVAQLRSGIDVTKEVSPQSLKAASSSLCLTAYPEDLKQASFFIVTVPTPVDSQNRPDLMGLKLACYTIGRAIQPRNDTVIVFESTVAPGTTEDKCVPWLEIASNLKHGVDFFVGFSPERICPGDKSFDLESVIKVVAGDTEVTTQRMLSVYSPVVKAGVYVAPSIKVAEASKLLENVQRDVNIALMNEAAQIFDSLGICTEEVLEAARTKWNFMPFQPGLVGGHCISVDPYYLIEAASQSGVGSALIQSARDVNERVSLCIARHVFKNLFLKDVAVEKAKIGILGLTFKQDVSDIRNSKVADLVSHLESAGVTPLVHDPLCCSEDAINTYGIILTELEKFRNLDVLILAVPHKIYLKTVVSRIGLFLNKGGLLIDVQSKISPSLLPTEVNYWSL